MTATSPAHATANSSGPNGARIMRGHPVTRITSSDAKTAICSVRALPVTYGPNADRHTILAHHKVFGLAVMLADASCHHMMTSGDRS